MKSRKMLMPFLPCPGSVPKSLLLTGGGLAKASLLGVGV